MNDIKLCVTMCTSMFGIEIYEKNKYRDWHVHCLLAVPDHWWPLRNQCHTLTSLSLYANNKARDKNEHRGFCFFTEIWGCLLAGTLHTYRVFAFQLTWAQRARQPLWLVSVGHPSCQLTWNLVWSFWVTSYQGQMGRSKIPKILLIGNPRLPPWPPS